MCVCHLCARFPPGEFQPQPPIPRCTIVIRPFAASFVGFAAWAFATGNSLNFSSAAFFLACLGIFEVRRISSRCCSLWCSSLHHPTNTFTRANTHAHTHTLSLSAVTFFCAHLAHSLQCCKILVTLAFAGGRYEIGANVGECQPDNCCKERRDRQTVCVCVHARVGGQHN